MENRIYKVMIRDTDEVIGEASTREEAEQLARENAKKANHSEYTIAEIVNGEIEDEDAYKVIWYAIQTPDYDDWDVGSWDYTTAVAMAEEAAKEHGSAKIAYINVDNEFCEDVEEI